MATLNPNVTAYVGRNSAGRIVLDMTSIERPACTLRLEFDDPEDAARLADDLSMAAEDHEHNRSAYPELLARED